MSNFKILIKNQNNNTYSFAMEKKPVMTPVIGKDENGEDTINYKETGKFELVEFIRSDFEEVKEKYMELLEVHRTNELNIVDDCTEKVSVVLTLQDNKTPVEETPSEDEEPSEDESKEEEVPTPTPPAEENDEEADDQEEVTA